MAYCTHHSMAFGLGGRRGCLTNSMVARRSSAWGVAFPAPHCGLSGIAAEDINTPLRCRGARLRCWASDEPGSGPTATQEPPSPSTPSPSAQPSEPPKPRVQSARIERTLADLDALLGIQEESAGAPPSPPPRPADAEPPGTTGTSPASQSEQQQPPLTPDARRNGTQQVPDEVEQQLQRLVNRARQLANENKSDTRSSTAQDEQGLRREFETMLQTLGSAPPTLDKEDIKRLKEAAFGPLTFFVTETQPIVRPDRTGLLVRGNLRDDRSKVLAHVIDKVKELFGDKYTVILVEDEAAQLESAAMGGMGGSSAGPRASGAANRAQELNTPRVAFQIVPTAQAQPPQSNGWRQAIAVVLALLFLGSCGQLALAANITKLPRETLDWLSNPANFESDALPPGLEAWDPLPYFTTAAPLFGAVVSSNVLHELGHRIAAAVRAVRLGPAYFIPNFQVGAFGGITPFTSMLKDRKVLWDVAAAGPLAGVLFSTAILAVGLAQSQPGQLPADLLLFQGSLLLGGIVRVALGEAALRASEVPVSPLVVAGWCGLITQALQLLPVGSTDGGRMVQATYGQGTLALTSFFTYVGLGLGLLGSSLALPYGLYVIICLRTAEKYVQDNVTPAGDERGAATSAAILLAILLLVPMAPELADSFGIGPGRDGFF